MIINCWVSNVSHLQNRGIPKSRVSFKFQMHYYFNFWSLFDQIDNCDIDCITISEQASVILSMVLKTKNYCFKMVLNYPFKRFTSYISNEIGVWTFVDLKIFFSNSATVQDAFKAWIIAYDLWKKKEHV